MALPNDIDGHFVEQPDNTSGTNGMAVNDSQAPGSAADLSTVDTSGGGSTPGNFNQGLN